MPNWKKVIISGSDASLNSLTLTNGATGSFTGSFIGDGSQLTGITTSPGGSDGQIQYNNGGVLNGTSDLYYDDVNNRVGIGTTSPDYKLDVDGIIQASGNRPVALDPTTGKLFIDNKEIITLFSTAIKIGGIGSPDTITFSPNNVNLATMKSGKLGIGTTSPSSTLDVVGTVEISEIAATTDTDKFAVLDTGIIKYRTGAEVLSDIGAQASLTNPITGTGTSGQVSFFNGTTTQTGDDGLFWDNSNKRLGIGTTTPSEKLDVHGDTNITGSLTVLQTGSISYITGDKIVVDNSEDGNQIGRLIIDYNAGLNPSIRSAGDDYIQFDNDLRLQGNSNVISGPQSTAGLRIKAQRVDTPIAFETAPTTTGDYSEAMRIIGNGDVGIGTTTPSEKLTVEGNISSSGFIQANNFTGSYIDLDVLADGNMPSHKAGRIFFGQEDGALEVYNEEADITLQVGQEFWIRAYNKSGGIILNGTPVRASGSQGDRIGIYPALAEDHTTENSFENHILGVTTHDIGINEEGYVTAQGVVRGVDTSTFTAGDTLYLQTGSAGFRNTPPPFPYDIVQVGYVSKQASPNGFIFVEPKEPVHFNNISGLSGSAPEVGDLWVYQPNNAWTPSKILSGSYTIEGGDFNVEGTITAKEFHTEFVSSSIIYDSGSTKFGDTSDDVHAFTGSVEVLGGITGSFSGSLAAPGTDGQIQYNSGSVLQGASTLYYDDTNNRLGIGTALPTSPLHINDDAPTIRIQDATSGDNHYITGNNSELRIQTSGFMTIRPNNTELVRLTTDGRVGIGTTSPSEELEVDGTIRVGNSLTPSSYLDLKLIGGNARINASDSFVFEQGSTSALYFRSGTGGIYFNDNTPEKIRFNNNQVLFDDNGNVGIGTTSPDSKVHVDASKREHIFFDASGETGADKIVGFFSPQDTKWEIGPTNKEVGTVGPRIDIVGENYTASPDTIRMITGDSARMVITTDGDVGIGTTSPSYKLEVTGDGYFSNTLNLANTGLKINPGGSEYSIIRNPGSGVLEFTGQQTGFSSYSFTTTGKTDALVVEDSGDVKIDQSILSNQQNTDVDTGTETVATVSSTDYDGVFFDYVIKNGTNLRAGTVTAVHDGTNVSFNEVSTQDIGDTSDVELSVDLSGGDIRLLATAASDNWTVKTILRGI
jgi:hypothetical protein